MKDNFKMKNKNIALLGTYYEQSHGDALLFDCVSYIYKDLQDKHGLNLNFKIIDLFGKTEIVYNDNDNVYKKTDCGKVKKFLKRFRIINYCLNKRNNCKIYKDLKIYYRNNLQKMNMVVVVGRRITKI